jgi:RNA polymerase sigma-70 factor, ECF subfamily
MRIFDAVAAFDHDSGRLPFASSPAGTRLMNSTRLHVNLEHSGANETDVMLGVQAHERLALERLYLAYYGPVARFLSGVVAQTSAVDEIINDSFITIWKRAAEFRGESRVATWIFAIVYRTALQSMEPRVQGPRLAETPRRRDTDFASENPYFERLERRLHRLPLEERVILALAYRLGFSIDEIAKITQVAPATVKMRMSQASMDFRSNQRASSPSISSTQMACSHLVGNSRTTRSAK